jgi:hypothetical protein
MKRSAAPLYAGTLLCLLIPGAVARAGFIPFDYSWSRKPIILAAENHGTGGIAFTHQFARHATGPVNVIASTLVLFSSAPQNHPDRLSKVPYALTLTIRDDTSHRSGSMTFHGLLSGTFWAGGASISNTFLSPKIQAIHLGHYWYTVTMGPFIAPTVSQVGYVEAHIGVRHNPEPSSVVLWGLGLAVLGLVGWRRHVRAKRAASGNA